MKSLKKLFSIFVFFGLGLFMASSVMAAGLNLELIKQTPNPVNPGNFVYVSVQVSNLGSNSVAGAKIYFEESDNFKIADGEDRVKNLGVISEKNSVIKRFKIFVGNNAPLGLNSLKFRVESGSIVENTVDILVGSSNVGLIARSFDSNLVAPGSSAKLSLELENLNVNDLKNVIVNLDLNSVENKVFSLESGSNQKVIGSVLGGQKALVEYGIVASPTAESKPYLVPATITYSDDLGTQYNKTVLGTIKVYSEPVLSLNLDSQSSYSTGKGVYTFAIANPGTSTIKGTTLEILEGDNYDVVSGGIHYVGNLNSDDFQTIQSEIYALSNELSSVKVKINYLDSYNKQTEKIYDIPVSVYSKEELAKYGLAGAKSSSGGSAATYIVFLVLIVGAFYFGKKRGKKHN